MGLSPSHLPFLWFLFSLSWIVQMICVKSVIVYTTVCACVCLCVCVFDCWRNNWISQYINVTLIIHTLFFWPIYFLKTVFLCLPPPIQQSVWPSQPCQSPLCTGSQHPVTHTKHSVSKQGPRKQALREGGPWLGVVGPCSLVLLPPNTFCLSRPPRFATLCLAMSPSISDCLYQPGRHPTLLWSE